NPMFDVETRMNVARKRRSHSSIASQRSSSGLRFHRPQAEHTAHRRPFSASKASRSPMGKCSTDSFSPSAALQNRQVEYIAGSGKREAGSGKREAGSGKREAGVHARSWQVTRQVQIGQPMPSKRR